MKPTKELIAIACELYKQGNSVRQVAELMDQIYRLKFHQNTWRHHLSKVGMLFRDYKQARRMHIDVLRLLEAYKETPFVRVLHKRTGIGRLTIKKILRENGLKIMENKRATQLINLRHDKLPFNGTDQEKAYVYGFVVGDVHVYRKSEFTLCAITHSTHNSFVELFNGLFKKYGNVMIKFKEKRNEWMLSAHLDYESFKFLEDRTKNKLPDWINDDNFIYFLSGLIDSDGSIQIRKSGKYFQYVIRLFGEDKELLEEIKTRLEKLGYTPSFYRNFKAGREHVWNGKIFRYNRDYYVLEMYKKEDSLRLMKSLHLQHKEKIRRKEFSLEVSKRNVFHWDEIKEELLALRSQIKEEALARAN